MTTLAKARAHGRNSNLDDSNFLRDRPLGERWRDRQEEAVQKRLETRKRRKQVTLPRLSFVD